MAIATASCFTGVSGGICICSGYIRCDYIGCDASQVAPPLAFESVLCNIGLEVDADLAVVVDHLQRMDLFELVSYGESVLQASCPLPSSVFRAPSL